MSDHMENPVDVARREGVKPYLDNLIKEDEKKYEEGTVAYRVATALRRQANTILFLEEQSKKATGEPAMESVVQAMIDDLNKNLIPEALKKTNS